MLKINFTETPSEERWILHGKLTAPWVPELRACWKKNHRKDKQRACIVDLNEITFIDKSGERLLRVLLREGAQCLATGVYVKHVLEQLTTKGKGSVLKRLAGFFLAAVIAAFAVRFGAECIATGVYIKHGLEQLATKGKGSVLNRLTGFFFAAVVAVFAVLIGGATAKAQNTAVTGSVPSGLASDQVLQLTLRDAVNMALRYNLGAIESGANAQIARGQRLLALSNLLPQVSAGASETVQQLNLGTLGLSGLKLPGIPTIVGPFSYSSMDASVSQTLFSFESIQRFRAARTAEQAAQLSYQDILDVVTLTVGNAYLQIIEADSRIKAQEAQVLNARALYDRAVDQVQAGTAPRIDATRTEVQLHTEEYNLSIARNNFELTKLALGRAIGLPLGQQFELADTLPYSDITPLTVDDALNIAYKSRNDFRSALDSQKAAAQTLSAAKGERYPTVAVNGDYGDIGPTFGHSHGDFTFQAGIRIPLFTGGRIKGDITQAEAELRQRKAEAENTRGEIDQDVRTSLLNINAAKEQVEVAKQNVGLANESLARSKDRFTSGVTDSVEVVQAEQALASANDQYITSLYNHNFAKLSLARALGVARTNYQQYLGGK
ncbi:MAG TPA: TolC family protein [Candidatus Saccharimonadales bacterium]|nr:TolC family protein [Candidatus Saccharimonadales bacterium]